MNRLSADDAYFGQQLICSEISRYILESADAFWSQLMQYIKSSGTYYLVS